MAKEKLEAQLIKKKKRKLGCGGEIAGVQEISGWFQPAGTESSLSCVLQIKAPHEYALE